MTHMKKIAFIALFLLSFGRSAQAQDQLPKLDSVKMLLTTMAIQTELTIGVNQMYNNNFRDAEIQFNWLKNYYPQHPMPQFLLGLSNWWKIMPNTDNTKYDFIFLAYMDSTIYYGNKMYKKDPKNVEAAFFLSAAHAFKARLYSERKKWKKAAVEGKKALKFLEKCEGKNYLSPELLFGDGLYNYYSVWIPENYPALKPILIFFKKGNKKKGIEQLEEVRREAFYTRVEAQLFLMRIYAIEEKQNQKAFFIADHLHNTFPNNPYFHRFYARMLFTTGKLTKMKKVSEEILERIDAGWMGYEEISGRYAAYYLGYWYDSPRRDRKKALEYYKKAVYFAEKIEAYKSGYYLLSLVKLAKAAEREKKYDAAKKYYDKVLKYGNKKKTYYKDAKAYKKKYKKVYSKGK